MVIEAEIADRLKTFRMSKKMTQKDMAKSLCYQVYAYNRIEKGARNLRAIDFKHIYNMGCNLNWLFTGEGVMNEELYKSESDLIETIHKTTDVLLNVSENAKYQGSAIDKQASIIDKQVDTIKILASK